MAVQSYKDLEVWQLSMDMTEEVYRLVNELPKIELYALSDQIRRAAVSIPSNIAEGQARNSSKEFIHFLSVAKGSKAELETQLLLCVRLGYISEDRIKPILDLSERIGKMMTNLRKSLMDRVS